MCVVYLITTDTKKVYVGYTDDFEERKYAHLTAIQSADKTKKYSIHKALARENIDSIRIFPVTGEMGKLDALYTESRLITIFYFLDGFTVLNQVKKHNYRHLAEKAINPLVLPPESQMIEAIASALSGITFRQFANESNTGSGKLINQLDKYLNEKEQ